MTPKINLSDRYDVRTDSSSEFPPPPQYIKLSALIA